MYDEIEIEDMTYDPTLQIYHYPCPCGDRFEIGIADLKDGEDVAVCPSCSLMIRVVFDVVSCICSAVDDGGGGKGADGVFFIRMIYRGRRMRGWCRGLLLGFECWDADGSFLTGRRGGEGKGVVVGEGLRLQTHQYTDATIRWTFGQYHISVYDTRMDGLLWMTDSAVVVDVTDICGTQ